MKLLLIEDDPLIGHGVSQAMQESRHHIDWVRDGAATLAALDADSYDAILLDLGLPQMDGAEILQYLRQRGDGTPVIVITARDAVAERIRVLDLGADDYLVKPFSLGELQARLRAVSRRNTGTGNPILETAALKLDPNRALAEAHGSQVQLSSREFMLLETLMRRPGQIFSREQLESRVYSLDDDIASNAIEVLIHALRKKLGKDAIKNIRGLGWMVPQ